MMTSGLENAAACVEETLSISPGGGAGGLRASIRSSTSRATRLPAWLADAQFDLTPSSRHQSGRVAKRNGRRAVDGGSVPLGWTSCGEVKSTSSTHSERAHAAGLLLNILLDVPLPVHQEVAIQHAYDSRGRDDAVHYGRRARSLQWLGKLSQRQLMEARTALAVAGRPPPRSSLLVGVSRLDAPLEHLSWLRTQLRLSGDVSRPPSGRCFLLPPVRARKYYY
jgi:hypothetical protein